MGVSECLRLRQRKQRQPAMATNVTPIAEPPPMSSVWVNRRSIGRDVRDGVEEYEAVCECVAELDDVCDGV